MAEQRLAGIGEVVEELRGDFPGVSMSKLRFLESQGLVSPQRTEGGYRKYSRTDVAKLRWVLAQQSEHFLPLRVIKERMADVSWGAQTVEDDSPPPAANVGEQFHRIAGAAPAEGHSDVSMTLPQLAEASGLSARQVRELKRYGLLVPRPAADIDFYDAASLEVARIARQMFDLGLEPRHLRVFKASVERELDLSTPAAQRLLQAGGPDGQRRARELVTRHAALASSLREALVRSSLQNLY